MNEKDVFTEIAKDYEDQGYSVVIEPDESLFPFSLDGYRPDLYCKKGDENIIIEIKTMIWKESLEKYRHIARIVAGHEGWKFILVHYKYNEETVYSNLEDDLNIDKALSKLKKLLDLEMYDSALAFSWNILIYLVKIYMKKTENIEWKTSDKNLINELYSEGSISLNEYDQIIKSYNQRNIAVHNINSSVNKDDVLAILKVIEQKASDWKLEKKLNFSLLGI